MHELMFMKFRNRVTSWVLNKLDIKVLSAELRNRGWRIIPGSVLKKHFPEEYRTGWWPYIGDDPDKGL